MKTMFHAVFYLPIFVLFHDTYASENIVTPECERKATSFAMLDLAKEAVSKAKGIQDGDVTPLQCGKEKQLGFLDVAVNLITDAQKMFELNLQNQTFLSERKPMDCMEIFETGQNTSGEYVVWPRSRVSYKKLLKVHCDMETDGGGWTVIQRRKNVSNQVDFYSDWQLYKVGFGNVNEEFWIGNDNIFSLSNQGMNRIRFDLQDVDGIKVYAIYDTFWIDDENYDYKLHIENYSGNAGDAMAEHNLQKFSTKDKRNDKAPGESCANTRHGGWWYFNCAKANLNGLYQPGKKADYKSVYWYQWKNLDGLAAVEIKIRRK